MEYQSIRRASKNELGHEEITLVEHQTLWQSLFKIEPTPESYVCVEHEWRNKVDGSCVSLEMGWTLDEIRNQMIYQQKVMEHEKSELSKL